MTSLYERLQDGPQIDIDRAQPAPKERTELRTLSVKRSSTNESPEYPGSFTSVYYLEGEERHAAKRFVEENREQLELVDYSNPDIVASSLDREAYDWVLHFLGERTLRKYSNVVYERRRDGTEWVIDRHHFETHPDHRYRRQNEPAARIDPAYSIDEVYEQLDARIQERDLRKFPGVTGDVRCVLEYFRVASLFDCKPIGDAAYPYFGADSTESVSTEFDVADPAVEFANLDADDNVQIATTEDAVISGETNVAPGSESDIRIRNAGDTPSFLNTPSAEIDSDGSFESEEVDFSDRAEDDAAIVTCRVGDSSVGSADGIFVESIEDDADDELPEEDDEPPETDDDPAPPSDDTADDTEDDGVPGFGLAIAVVALLAAAMLALRRQN